MAYCTSTDIEARVPTQRMIQLTDDEHLADDRGTLAAAVVLNVAITDRITGAIEDADTVIDSHIRKQYSVPLASTPNTIRKASVDLAVFNLHSRRDGELDLPESVRLRYTEAIRILKGINTGDIDIGIEAVPASSAKSVATAVGPDRVFTTDTLRDF